MPRIWLDENGLRVPTRVAAAVSTQVRRYRYDALRQIGWPLYPVASIYELVGTGKS